MFVDARRTGHADPGVARGVQAGQHRRRQRHRRRGHRATRDGAGETIGGWKIGFVYSPRQKPMICPLFDSRLFASPARVPLSLTPSLRIEPEISFRLHA